MRFETLLYFYGRRLRTHPIQELLAGLGIAIGVALAFSAMVANGSIAGTATQIVRSVTGSADLQLSARDARGFDEELLTEVRALPSVRRAAPLLDQRAVLSTPNGNHIAVDLASVDQSLAMLSGRLAGNFVAGGLQLIHGIMLPTATAQSLGIGGPGSKGVVGPLPAVTVNIRGRVVDMHVAAVLGSETIGPIASARIGIVPLARLQQLAGLPRRITSILVEARPQQLEETRNALTRIAAEHHLSVAPADDETQLLREALGPSNQATGFFAAMSALLGFLLAFNAMLLTAPERRRLIAELRIQGFRPRQLITLLLFQAFVLGVVASFVGLLAGGVLSRNVFHQSSDYLSPAFTLGTGTVVGFTPIVLSLAGGIVFCCLAAAPPLLDLRRSRALDAIFQAGGQPGNALGKRTRRDFLALGFVLLAVATVTMRLFPSTALPGCALLALATVCAIPTTFATLVRLGEGLTTHVPRLNMLTVALLALRATTLRSLALAATGGVAVFGSVAIGSARDDLLRGIFHYSSDYVHTADLWIVNRNDNQATSDLRAGNLQARVAGISAVASVRPYQGGFLDMDGRRVWLIARPANDPAMLPSSQLVHGSLGTATSRLRGGGWVAISEQIAHAQHVDVGDVMTIPSPTGDQQYRVAATTTNLGWPPGAVILNGSDYARAWATHEPTALEVNVRNGANPLAVRVAIEQVLGAKSGLLVQTARERMAGINASAHEGLNRLRQISVLLLIAAVLAMAAAMGAAIWQRRISLAALRIQSFTPRQLWRVLLLESAVVLGAGCLTGAVAGMYGQIAIDRYLRLVTGFPVELAAPGWQTVETFALVVASALVAVAIPGWFATRVPPHLGLQE